MIWKTCKCQQPFNPTHAINSTKRIAQKQNGKPRATKTKKVIVFYANCPHLPRSAVTNYDFFGRRLTFWRWGICTDPWFFSQPMVNRMRGWFKVEVNLNIWVGQVCVDITTLCNKTEPAQSAYLAQNKYKTQNSQHAWSFRLSKQLWNCFSVNSDYFRDNWTQLAMQCPEQLVCSMLDLYPYYKHSSI